MTYSHSNWFLMIPLTQSTVLSISSSSWISVWMFIELNMMMMIPIMMTSKSIMKTEMVVKYLIVQSMTSAGLLICALMLSSMKMMLFIKLMFLIIIVMKIGGAPCHQWMLSVTKNLNLTPFMLMLTWQKITMLMVFLYNSQNTNIINLVALMNIMTGTLAGVSQTHMRPLLTYSSIAHLGWIMIAMNTSMMALIMYTTLYFMLMINLLYSIKPEINLYSWDQSNIEQSSKNVMEVSFLNFLAMAGMPPLLGFSIKWMILWLTMSKPLIVMMLLISSMISLMYYLMIGINYVLLRQKFIYLKTPLTKTMMMIHMLGPVMITMM